MEDKKFIKNENQKTNTKNINFTAKQAEALATQYNMGASCKQTEIKK